MMSLILLVALIGSSAAAKIGFSLQLRGRGHIDTNTGAFQIHARGPSQIDKVKITPQHGITYEVENKIGSFATLDASGTGANQVVLGNITFGTHQSQDHTIQFAGSVFGEDAGQSSYFSVLGLPTSGTGQFLGITGRLSAAGVFERFNTSGIDAIGTLHFTLYGETP